MTWTAPAMAFLLPRIPILQTDATGEVVIVIGSGSSWRRITGNQIARRRDALALVHAEGPGEGAGWHRGVPVT